MSFYVEVKYYNYMGDLSTAITTIQTDEKLSGKNIFGPYSSKQAADNAISKLCITYSGVYVQTSPMTYKLIEE